MYSEHNQNAPKSNRHYLISVGVLSIYCICLLVYFLKERLDTFITNGFIILGLGIFIIIFLTILQWKLGYAGLGTAIYAVACFFAGWLFFNIFVENKYKIFKMQSESITR